MIRFFRTIRQGLINENKVLKYLKYAIGEILLVMIGILLALSVNNWNEERKVEQQRLKLIKNLESDFQRNLESVEQVIADVEELQSGLETFLENATGDNSDLTVDELKTLAENVRPNNRFEPFLGFYRAAISTGSIALLGDSELNNLLVEFEHHNNRLQYYDSIGVGINFSDSGSFMEISKQLGTLNVLWSSFASTRYIPESYNLSEEEYRKFISRKEVYAHFDLKHRLNRRQPKKS
ncbi:MAG: DUF6090 family protein [Verrucomicrobia bacterium]|nr:DUF6090 family protein [Verrucomicrobiota bacterium]MDA1067268.1 DUF6090 family protein [Verrucomicrobiota bacterium]